MILTTKIKFDSQNNDTTTTLDKFFQFIIIDKLDGNRCKVSIYNAISFSNDGDHSKLVIEFFDQKNDQISSVKFMDYKKFYEETNILKQFWGKSSEYSANISATINNFAKDLESEERTKIQEALSACCSSGVFGVSENKDSIENFIINPSTAEFSTGQVKLPCHFPSKQEDSPKLLSNGYWFKAEFELDLNTGPSGFNIESRLEFSNKSKFKSPDFKIYIQTGKKYDLRSSKITVVGQKTDYFGEVVKVFSQSKIKYFTEWAEHGIYSSSLFKASPGTTAEKAIKESGLKSISVTVELEDLELPRRREINLLIFSIIFSLFASFGFDRTRQGDVGFKDIFPFSNYLSIDVNWLIVCIGILIFYYSLKNFTWRLRFKIIAISPISLWFFSYLILNGSIWGNEILVSNIGLAFSHFLYKSNIVIASILLIGGVSIKLSEKIKILSNFKIKFKKIIKVLKGEL
ncbi:MAG: hypothetical protein ACTINA_11040 [Pseudoalteromonas distincta]